MRDTTFTRILSLIRQVIARSKLASSTLRLVNSAGNLQGLHNTASYNLQTVQNARNSALGGPSSGGHQSGGNLPPGRFTANNLAVGLSQVKSLCTVVWDFTQNTELNSYLEMNTFVWF